MTFKPYLPAQQEKVLVINRVANIVSVPGPLRDLIDEPLDVEEQAADIAADLVDRMYDAAEEIRFNSFGHYTDPSHLGDVDPNVGAVQDNMTAPCRYEVIKTRTVPNPEPPPAEIEERYYAPGPTMAELLAPTLWPTATMLFSVTMQSVDAKRTMDDNQISFVLRCEMVVGVTRFAFDVGVGYRGDELTTTYYEVEEEA